MSIVLRLLSFIFCLNLLSFTSFSEGVPASEDFIQKKFAALKSDNSDTIHQAVEALVNSKDIRFNALLAGLYHSNLYVLKNAESNRGLVIVGESFKVEDETFYPVYAAFPRRAPLKDASGKELKVNKNQLKEVEATRLTRGLIEPLMTYINLTADEIEIRKMAIQTIASTGTPEDIAILEGVIKIEKDPIVARNAKEAIYMLQMQSADPAVRLKAVKNLETNYGENALSFLEEKVKKNEKGIVAEKDAIVQKEMNLAIENIKSRNKYLTISQNLFSGLSLGSILILMALGLAVIYGLMGVINMAHGEFMMIGAYTTFIIQSIFINNVPEQYFDYFFVLSLPLSFIIAGAFGYLIEMLIIRHLYKRPLESLLATWGVSLMLIQAARSIFGDLTSVKTPAIFSGGLEIVPQLVLPYNRLFIIGLTILIVLVVMGVLFKTSFGLKIRAVTQNRDMSACLGIPTRKVDSMAFFLGTGIAGLAGWAITLIGNVVPNMGQSYIVDSFLVVVTGGVGKLLGTIWSGLGIGFFSKFLEFMFEAVYGKVIILGLIILFLQIKPTGLFPAKGRHED